MVTLELIYVPPSKKILKIRSCKICIHFFSFFFPLQIYQNCIATEQKFAETPVWDFRGFPNVRQFYIPLNKTHLQGTVNVAFRFDFHFSRLYFKTKRSDQNHRKRCNRYISIINVCLISSLPGNCSMFVFHVHIGPSRNVKLTNARTLKGVWPRAETLTNMGSVCGDLI